MSRGVVLCPTEGKDDDDDDGRVSITGLEGGGGGLVGGWVAIGWGTVKSGEVEGMD